MREGLSSGMSFLSTASALALLRQIKNTLGEAGGVEFRRRCCIVSEVDDPADSVLKDITVREQAPATTACHSGIPSTHQVVLLSLPGRHLLRQIRVTALHVWQQHSMCVLLSRNHGLHRTPRHLSIQLIIKEAVSK